MVAQIRGIAVELGVRVQIQDKEKESHKDFLLDWRLPRAVVKRMGSGLPVLLTGFICFILE